MKVFLCVYRHPIISPKDRQKVEQNAINNQLLHLFLNQYFQPDSRYDWGDDPSFFQATQVLGDPRLASWGVCRWEVRQQLKPRDLVIFICGCEGPEKGSWKYFYIGYGTVFVSLQREDVFRDDQYTEYRSFFNMISRYENGEVVQFEVFGDKHAHFEDRCRAGYILFQPETTDFNLENPLPIARYDRGEAAEKWYMDDPVVNRLKTALFLDGTIHRHLNSGNWRRPHVHIPIHLHLQKAGLAAEITHVRLKLAEISTTIRNRCRQPLV